jgi:hypothetical protein
VSIDPGAASASRPRPLAELELGALAARGEDLARRWTIAMVRTLPFEAIGAIPVEGLARDGPPLCAQTIRALQSDVELDRLTGGGAPTGREQTALGPRLAAISGAADAVAAVQAVEALRGAVWQALLEELRGAGERSLPDLADRLAHVCAELLAAALSAAGATAEAPRLGPEGHDPALAREPAPGAPPRPAPSAPSARPAAVIVDERPAGRPPRTEDRPAGGRRERGSHERRSSWEGAGRAAAVVEQPPAWAPAADDDSPELEIEIRDERGDRGPAAWIGSIGRQLERYERDGQPFAVLLVEPLEIERLRRDESSAELNRLAGAVERALVRELGMAAPAAGGGRGAAFGAASLTRQHPGRHWLLVAAGEHHAANALAQRMVETVAATVSHRGEPLAVVVGTALCPDDGREAATLAAHADVGLYAARAAARSGRAPSPGSEPGSAS